MILFWLTIILLIIVALGFVLAPLLTIPKKMDRNEDNQQTQQNVIIYQARSAELQLALVHKIIDEQEFQRQQLRLQSDLVNDTEVESKVDHYSSKNPLTSVGRDWAAGIFLLFVFPVLALILYHYSGSSRQLEDYTKLQNQAQAVIRFKQQYNTPVQLIALLTEHLQQDPHSARGWYLLGKLYLNQQQFTEASDAFAKAYALEPNNPEVLFQYAQTLYLVQHSLRGKPNLLLQQLLKIRPQDPLAINLLAVGAFQDGRYQQAIDYWQQLLLHVPLESTDGQALVKAIATAQQAMQKQYKE